MKSAIVTGAGSGIGKAIAYALALQNYFVTVADIEVTRAEEVSAEIRKNGGKALATFVDISDKESIITMIDQTIHETGQLSLVVNNAGINFNYGVDNCPDEEFDRCIAINLKGHYLTSKYSIPYLKQSTGSSIVNIASTHAIRTQPQFFPYNAAKAGVLAMTRSMAIDLGKYNIRVNAVCPGFIQTNIMDQHIYDKNSSFMKNVLKFHPLGRIGKPEDIANAVVFLASDKASFIHGETLIIDGGRNALTYNLNNE